MAKRKISKKQRIANANKILTQNKKDEAKELELALLSGRRL